MRYLAEQHAVVTGGGRGIGAAIAEELARLGAHVTIMGRDVEVLSDAAEAIAGRCGVPTAAVECDVGDARAIARAFAAAREHLGPANILVNNAGYAKSYPFIETPVEEWQATLDVNLTGAFLCTQQVLPAMLEAGSGRIVNIASTAGLKGYNRLAAYCASKHGLVGLTRSLAMETAKKGVTVNAVCPGYTDAGMARDAIDSLVASGRSPEEARQMVVRIIPRGKLALPEEVASAVGWLCSPAAAAVTGIALPVAGGEVG